MTKIALGQLAVIPARPDLNAAKIMATMKDAYEAGAELLVFSELALSGSFIGQAWSYSAFLSDCLSYGEDIIKKTKKYKDMVVVFGNIGLMKDSSGKELPQSAIYVAQNGEAATGMAGNYTLKVGDNDLKFALLTQSQPTADIDMVLKLDTSFYMAGKTVEYAKSYALYAKTYGKTLVNVNHVGVQDSGKPVYVYEGNSAIYNKNGEVIGKVEPFKEDLVLVDTDAPQITEIPEIEDTKVLYDGLVHSVQALAGNLGITRGVIGLSGGIDSSVTACLLVAAFGKENVLGLNMPSVYNSETTKGIAADLAKALDIQFATVPVQECVDYTAKQLAEAGLPLDDTALENVQARDRGSRILAAAAASFGGAVACTGNKSEFTIGYATLHGDIAGFFAPLGDLWKCQVYQVAEYIHETFGTISRDAIDVKPSAELGSSMNIDEGLGDPLVYGYHDYLFRSWVDWGHDITDTISVYNDGNLCEVLGCGKNEFAQACPTAIDFVNDLERWWKMYKGLSVAKRLQAPTVLSMSRRAFGGDMPESQTGAYFPKEYLRLKATLLAKADNLV